MSEMIGVFHVSIGVLVALILAILLSYWYLRDITQKRHTVLRNFPVIGHLRFFFESLGEYFRQYFFLGDREEMPFNRANPGLGLSSGQERRRHPGFWFDLRHQPVRCADFRQCRFPRARSRTSADTCGTDW